jgi:hypothetical protein
VTAPGGAVPSSDLPAKSPFFGSETAAEARDRLRDLFDDAEAASSAAKAMVGLRAKSKARAFMCYGAAVLDPTLAAKPVLVGLDVDRMLMVASIAKLAVLFAAHQLRADCEVILGTAGIADSGDADERATAAAAAVVAAFAASNDSELQAIAKSPTNMPILDRIFDLTGFLAPGSRSRRTLEFSDIKSGTSGAEDDKSFSDRLFDTINASDDDGAASCIADVGLPYIQALLTRSGLADVSAPKKGLWLASSYGSWPRRKKSRVIKSGTSERACESLGSKRGLGFTGQGGTVRALATFMLLLHRGQLVNKAACLEMKRLMDDSAELFLKEGLTKSVASPKSCWSKVGYVSYSGANVGSNKINAGRWDHDAALFVSDNVKAKTVTWTAVALRGLGDDSIRNIAGDLLNAITIDL